MIHNTTGINIGHCFARKPLLVFEVPASHASYFLHLNSSATLSLCIGCG
jgi:hypothetical protein